MPNVTILHNPRCSKSRQTLQLLQEQNCDITIVEYLKNPLGVSELQQVLQQLGMNSARELMRTKEADYKDNNLADTALSETQLLEAMVTYPKLMERPVVIAGLGIFFKLNRRNKPLIQHILNLLGNLLVG